MHAFERFIAKIYDLAITRSLKNTLRDHMQKTPTFFAKRSVGKQTPQAALFKSVVLPFCLPDTPPPSLFFQGRRSELQRGSEIE